MTELHRDARPGATPTSARPWAGPSDGRPRWPLCTAAAGLLGLAGSLVPGRLATTLAWGAAAALLVAAALWRRWVEPRVRHSTAAYVVPFGLVASAAALTHRADGAAWLGVAVTATAVAWMALHERTVSRWIGIVSLAPAAQTLAALGVGDPGVPALGPWWLLVTGVGLAVGRSTIVR